MFAAGEQKHIAVPREAVERGVVARRQCIRKAIRRKKYNGAAAAESLGTELHGSDRIRGVLAGLGRRDPALAAAAGKGERRVETAVGRSEKIGDFGFAILLEDHGSAAGLL